jgi:hypothetical protein
MDHGQLLHRIAELERENQSLRSQLQPARPALKRSQSDSSFRPHKRPCLDLDEDREFANLDTKEFDAGSFAPHVTQHPYKDINNEVTWRIPEGAYSVDMHHGGELYCFQRHRDLSTATSRLHRYASLYQLRFICGYNRIENHSLTLIHPADDVTSLLFASVRQQHSYFATFYTTCLFNPVKRFTHGLPFYGFRRNKYTET